jgi:predicted naringenin-chalcone synthase
LENAKINKEDISHWCIHPGGKRILTSIEKSAGITSKDLHDSYHVLNDYGNMSSPTILFVLKEIMDSFKTKKEMPVNIFGAAFGPGLTMETFILSGQQNAS